MCAQVIPTDFFKQLKTYKDKFNDVKGDKKNKIESLFITAVSTPSFNNQAVYDMIIQEPNYEPLLELFKSLLERCYSQIPILDPFVTNFLKNKLPPPKPSPKLKEKKKKKLQQKQQESEPQIQSSSNIVVNPAFSDDTTPFYEDSHSKSQQFVSENQNNQSQPEQPNIRQDEAQAQPIQVQPQLDEAGENDMFRKMINEINEAEPQNKFQHAGKYAEYFHPMVAVEKHVVMISGTKKFENISVSWRWSKKGVLFCELEIKDFPDEDVCPFDNKVYLTYKAESDENGDPLKQPFTICTTGSLVSMNEGIYRVRIDEKDNNVSEFFKKAELLTTNWGVVIEPEGTPYKRMFQAIENLLLPTKKENAEKSKKDFEEFEAVGDEEEEAHRLTLTGNRKNTAKSGKNKSNAKRSMNFAEKKVLKDRESCISDQVLNALLGKEFTQNPPTVLENIVYDVTNLPPANESQRTSIKNAFTFPISLIQGPPGTGKTITASAIVWNWVNKLPKGYKMNKVLVCAPSNYAVDRLTEKLAQTLLKVVRVFSKARELQSYPFDDLTLHKQRDQLFEDKFGFKDYDEVKKAEIMSSLEREILEKADVVCCTCTTAASRRIGPFSFKSVLIDESTQSTEPECLIPITRGSERVVLIGDPKQLSGYVQCKEIEAKLGRSMFARLMDIGTPLSFLDTQHRMHPHLSYFPRIQFYNDLLKDGVAPDDRIDKYDFPFPNRDKPSFFIDVYNGIEEREESRSFSNHAEAQIVVGILEKLHAKGCPLEEIGIITPYLAQRRLIRELIGDKLDLVKLEIATVDSFQGKEKDYIIYCSVRSNDRRAIGFVSNPNRMNVAITRCKYGLMVVGSFDTLYKNDPWKNFLYLMKNAQLVITPTEAEERGIIPKLEAIAQDFFKNEEFQNSMIDTSKITSSKPIAYYEMVISQQNSELPLDYESDDDDDETAGANESSSSSTNGNSDPLRRILDEESYQRVKDSLAVSISNFDEKEESKLRLEVVALMLTQDYEKLGKKITAMDDIMNRLSEHDISSENLDYDMCHYPECFYFLTVKNRLFLSVRDVSTLSKNLKTEKKIEFYLNKINEYKKEKQKKKEEALQRQLEREKLLQDELAKRAAENDNYYSHN